MCLTVPAVFTARLERQRQIVYLLFGGAFATFARFGKNSSKRGADYVSDALRSRFRCSRQRSAGSLVLSCGALRQLVDDCGLGGDPPGNLLGGGAVRARSGNEDSLPVVAELIDGVLDVAQCAVPAEFGRGLEVGAGEPAAGQFLDGAYVDDPVVQMLHEGGHVPGQEDPVRA